VKIRGFFCAKFVCPVIFLYPTTSKSVSVKKGAPVLKKIIFLTTLLIFCALALTPLGVPAWRVSAVPGLRQIGEGRLLFPGEGINSLSIAGSAAVIEERQPILQLQTGTVWHREPLGVANGFASAFRFRSFPKAHEGAASRLRHEQTRVCFFPIDNQFQPIPAAFGLPHTFEHER
jgi:hypothetical protein